MMIAADSSHAAASSPQRLDTRQPGVIRSAAQPRTSCTPASSRQALASLPLPSARGYPCSHDESKSVLPLGTFTAYVRAQAGRPPLVQAERQRHAIRPGPVVRGTFSPPRAWRSASVARFARTLAVASCVRRRGGKCDSPRCGILAHRHHPGRIMTTPTHDLAAEVLDLPAEERARILELLIASFEPKSNAQRAWMNLALRRREEVRSGKVAMIPGDEALARVKARIA